MYLIFILGNLVFVFHELSEQLRPALDLLMHFNHPVLSPGGEG